ncbi:ATP-binding protein [Kitasatospora sp. NBC_01539]|uniref:ATP-binding protein n=1 Tax=Kitasatospora sp. NBC_01539 TaxID=2903577 RepID=UPI003860197B
MFCPPRTAAPVRTRCHRRAGECRAAVLRLPATPRAARLARSRCTRLLAVWGVPADDAIVVLAELVANAAEHGGSEMVVRLHRCGDRLEIEVVDSGASRSLPDVPGAGAVGDLEGLRGRGLPMVSALSERFLLRREADGSTRALALVRVDGRVAAVRPPDLRGSFAVACGLQASPA